MYHKYPYTDFHEANMDWFLSKFNSVLAEWADVSNKFDDVLNFFNNLDVQDEINNKLEEMVADGTLEGVFINRSNNTVYIKNDMDISAIVTALPENATLVLQKGDYTCDNATISADNVSIICDPGTNITTTKTAFTVNGDNFQMYGGQITGPEEWYPQTSVAIYGVIIVNKSASFENVTLFNISKAGIYAFAPVNIDNCTFAGYMPAEYYNTISINNQVYGVYIHAGADYNKTSTVNGSHFSDLIEGVYYGDYNYPYQTYSVLVSDCTFYNMYDHSCYINGGMNGVISNNISHNSNHAFVMMGAYHTIEGNTVYMPAGSETIHVTGISFREPVNCKAVNNTIMGNGLTGSSGISVNNLSGNPEPNTEIKNVLISGNVFKSTGAITCIRIGNNNQTESVRNVTIDNNIFDCENNPDRGFIVFECADLDGVNITNNNITFNGVFVFGIVIPGGTVNIQNNEFIIKGLTATTQRVCNIVSGVITGKVSDNVITLDNSSMTNLRLNLVRFTGTNRLIIERNILPAGAYLIANINNIFENIIIRDNIVGTDTTKGSFRTTAAGAFTISNANFIGGITDVIITAADEASAIYTNYYITSSNGSNTFNVFTIGANTNINLKYMIV